MPLGRLLGCVLGVGLSICAHILTATTNTGGEVKEKAALLQAAVENLDHKREGLSSFLRSRIVAYNKQGIRCFHAFLGVLQDNNGLQVLGIIHNPLA